MSADVFTTEVWTGKRLTRYLVFFLMDLVYTKSINLGITSRANGLWMSQVARHVRAAVNGI